MVSTILVNFMTCMRGYSQTLLFFKLTPPTLKEYLAPLHHETFNPNSVDPQELRSAKKQGEAQWGVEGHQTETHYRALGTMLYSCAAQLSSLLAILCSTFYCILHYLREFFCCCLNLP